MTDRMETYTTPALIRWRRWTDGPLIIAIGSLPFLLLELRSDELSSTDRTMVAVINIVVLVAFVVDYVVELALARNRARYVRYEWSSLVIVLSQALALVPGLQAIGVLRALRGARVGRFLIVGLRVVAIGHATNRDGRETIRRHAAAIALGSAALTWLSAAAAFVIAEGPQEDGELYSFSDALWWATTAITTVGYGDIVPTTSAGRLVAGVTMIVGISTFAVVTAKVAEFLVRVERSEQPLTPPQHDGE